MQLLEAIALIALSTSEPDLIDQTTATYLEAAALVGVKKKDEKKAPNQNPKLG